MEFRGITDDSKVVVCRICGKIRLYGGHDPFCTDCHFKYRTGGVCK